MVSSFDIFAPMARDPLEAIGALRVKLDDMYAATAHLQTGPDMDQMVGPANFQSPVHAARSLTFSGQGIRPWPPAAPN
jgi:hypothetical protein